MAFRGFERTLSLSPGSGDAPELAARLAAMAREALEDAQAAGEAPDLYVRSVNGRRGVPEQSVTMPGPIVYTFDWGPRAAAVALGQLQQRAPVLTGAYRSGFFVLVNGLQAEPEGAPFGASIAVTNDKPYSRKVQVGSKGFSDTRGMWDAAAAATQRLFPGVVRCRVVFIRLEGGYSLRRADRSRRRSRGLRSAGAELSYPAIRIERAVSGWN